MDKKRKERVKPALEENSHISRNRSLKKPSNTQHDIYVNSKTIFKAQLKQCTDILDSGVKDIYLHCLGNTINRGINLTLNLLNNSNNTLLYEIHTNSIKTTEELHPLCDDDDLVIKHRNKSAVHIKVSRKAVIGVDIN